MSVHETNRQVPLGAVTTFRVISFVERAVETWSNWRGVRATARTLSRLSDSQLADIGVARGEIGAVAHRTDRR